MPEKVSYVKEAAKEPINLVLIIMSFVGALYAAAVGHPNFFWVPLAAGASLESLYLMTLPATAAYRRTIDQRMRRRELAEKNRRREELIKTFDPREREAVEYLRWQKNQIYQNFQKFTRIDSIPPNIQTLETIWESFVDLLDTYRRRKNHLRSFNHQMIQNQINQTNRSIESSPDDDTRRLFEKNLELLNMRTKTYEDIDRSVKRVEAQLQSIESFFGLVNDQVVTMPTPEYISSLDFESLLSSIELTKEILEETAPVLNQLDSAERSSSQSIRPQLAQRQ